MLDKRKIHMCVTVPIDVKQGIEDSAKLFGMSQSKLLLEGYFEYLKNHYGEAVKPVSLTVNQVNEVKAVKVHCEIGKCNGKFNGSIGTYQGKSYNLCSDHAGKFTGLKGWIIK
jgi:hypothetical protein